MSLPPRCVATVYRTHNKWSMGSPPPGLCVRRSMAEELGRRSLAQAVERAEAAEAEVVKAKEALQAAEAQHRTRVAELEAERDSVDDRVRTAVARVEVEARAREAKLAKARDAAVAAERERAESCARELAAARREAARAVDEARREADVALAEERALKEALEEQLLQAEVRAMHLIATRELRLRVQGCSSEIKSGARWVVNARAERDVCRASCSRRAATRGTRSVDPVAAPATGTA